MAQSEGSTVRLLHLSIPAAALLLGTACEVGSSLVEKTEHFVEEPVRFSMPLAEPWRFPDTVGYDHDPEDHDDAQIPGSICTDYAGRGFPYCYDGHDGSDFIFQGGFNAMDEGSTPVIAAAEGVVISVMDGQYDRCHVDINEGSVTCDGHEMIANHVILEHSGGVISKYWHLKKDSVRVAVGDVVACGDPLGLVGSSGNSSLPHLHFEVELPGERVVDPFDDNGESWWIDPGPIGGVPASECDSSSP